MTAYYNEIEPYAAEWLRNLIKAGHIPHGEVDTRSIVDVRPADLAGFTQCHFFAGIGGWGLALRLAGWPDDRPIWTGSCPCQPFSVAGKGAGTDDPRHLWPHFHRLIAANRPPVVMGEQVAGKAGYGWLDGVRADLEGSGYSSRGVDIPALAVGAPHIRQRLYWVALDMADAQQHGHGRETSPAHHDRQEGDGPADQHGGRGGSSVCSHMAHPHQGGRGRRPHDGDSECDGQAGGRVEDHGVAAGGGEDRGDMGDANDAGLEGCDRPGHMELHRRAEQIRSGGTPSLPSAWSRAVWITGADGKARRVEPSIRLLAHGIPNRVGRLRAYGNAIVPQIAAEVIRAFMETAQWTFRNFSMTTTSATRISLSSPGAPSAPSTTGCRGSAPCPAPFTSS